MQNYNNLGKKKREKDEKKGEMEEVVAECTTSPPKLICSLVSKAPSPLGQITTRCCHCGFSCKEGLLCFMKRRRRSGSGPARAIKRVLTAFKLFFESLSSVPKGHHTFHFMF